MINKINLKYPVQASVSDYIPGIYGLQSCHHPSRLRIAKVDVSRFTRYVQRSRESNASYIQAIQEKF